MVAGPGQLSASRTASHTTWIGWVPLVFLPTTVLLIAGGLQPWQFMWLLAMAIFFGLKWASWWRVRTQVAHPAWRSSAYLFAWPGMDAEKFLNPSESPAKPQFRQWIWPMVKTAAGAGLFWIVAHRIPYPLAQGWIGLLGLVLLLHFGSFHLIALFWQACGVMAQPIMAKPILSKSLSEFWGKRWNLGFRQLAYDLVFQPTHKHIGPAMAGMLVFFLSGLIHDFVISVPAHGGYGLPTVYFILQGAGVALEHSTLGRRMGLQGGAIGRIFLFLVTGAPAFWLFHPPFVDHVIIPFMRAAHGL